MTSSIGLLANDDNPITVPRAAAARVRCANDVRGETELSERLDVVGGCEPLFAGGDERGVDRLRQSLLGALLRDCNGFKPCGASHVRPDFLCSSMSPAVQTAPTGWCACSLALVCRRPPSASTSPRERRD